MGEIRIIRLEDKIPLTALFQAMGEIREERKLTEAEKQLMRDIARKVRRIAATGQKKDTLELTGT
jgi:hypothetical protein